MDNRDAWPAMTKAFLSFPTTLRARVVAARLTVRQAGTARSVALLGGPLHRHAFTTLATDEGLDGRKPWERVQCFAVRAAGATNLARRQFNHCGCGMLRSNREDHRIAFVADDVGYVSAHLHLCEALSEARRNPAHFQRCLGAIRKALGADGLTCDLKRIAALDRELETAVVNRDTAYKAWIDHRQSHRV